MPVGVKPDQAGPEAVRRTGYRGMGRASAGRFPSSFFGTEQALIAIEGCALVRGANGAQLTRKRRL